MEGGKPDMVSQRQRFLDEIVDLVTAFDPAGAAMAAQVEGENREAIFQLARHATPGFEIGADPMDADQRQPTLTLKAPVEQHALDIELARARHGHALAAWRALSRSRAAKTGITSSTHSLIVFFCSSNGRLNVR